MIFSGHEARQNRELAETWRSNAVASLTSMAVKETLGLDFSFRLSKYVEHAGVLALSSVGAKVNKKYSLASDNGVYLAPTPQRLANSDIHIPYEKPKQYWTLPGLQPGNTGGAQHSCLNSLPGIHLITIPTEQVAQHSDEQAAVLAHEMTHVDQANDKVKWQDWINRSLSERVTDEAEGYGVQFKVLDASLDGALEQVCDATIKSGIVVANNEDKLLVVPNDTELPGGRSYLTETESWTVIHEAYNRITSYVPDRAKTAPQELIDIYKQYGHIR